MADAPSHDNAPYEESRGERRDRDDRFDRDELDRELDREFFVAEIAELHADLSQLVTKVDQLTAAMAPLAALTSELLRERHLRGEA